MLTGRWIYDIWCSRTFPYASHVITAVLFRNPIIGIYGNPQRFVKIKTNPLLQKDDYHHLFFHYLCIVSYVFPCNFIRSYNFLVRIPGSKIKVLFYIFLLFVDQVKVTIAYFILKASNLFTVLP